MSTYDFIDDMIDSSEQRHLINTLQAFAGVSGFPVSFIDEKNLEQWSYLENRKFCNIFPCREECSANCTTKLNMAKKTSQDIQEPYIFLCERGLINIIYSSPYNKGTFVVGPIFMGSSKEDLTRKLLKNVNSTKEYLPKVFSFLERTEVKSPLQVSQVYDIFCNCIFSYSLIDSNIHSMMHESENKIIKSKHPDGSLSYCTSASTASLITSIKKGDLASAMTNFRILFEKNYLIEVGKLNNTKAYLVKLFHVISRNITAGTITSSSYLEDLEKIYNAFSYADAYNFSKILLEKIVSSNCTITYTGSSAIIQRAIRYIHKNNTRQISLNELSNELHVNASYLSSLFKKETGKTFSQYIMTVRLKRSTELLKNTHDSVVNIAFECGFESQSYFIKKFKEQYKTTPAKYRKLQLDNK